MSRLVSKVITFCLYLGAGEALFFLTLKMAGLAVHAHKHEQLSYSKFTRSMISAPRRPRPTPGAVRNLQ